MSYPPTDAQNFSTFVALNRADLVGEPKETGKPWVGKFVIAGVVLVLALQLILGRL